MAIIEEFKKFALRGNVMELAIGVVIGGAFGKIVSSLVDDIITPILSFATGGIDLRNYKFVINNENVGILSKFAGSDITINYGNFLQSAINFLIIAVSIFFVIKAMNRLAKKEENKSTEANQAPSKQEEILMEIRDILRR